jgi:hypothetical protein
VRRLHLPGDIAAQRRYHPVIGRPPYRMDRILNNFFVAGLSPPAGVNSPVMKNPLLCQSARQSREASEVSYGSLGRTQSERRRRPVGERLSLSIRFAHFFVDRCVAPSCAGGRSAWMKCQRFRRCRASA